MVVGLGALAATVISGFAAASIDDRLSSRGVGGGVGALLLGCAALAVVASRWRSGFPGVQGDGVLRSLPCAATAAILSGLTLLSGEADGLIDAATPPSMRTVAVAVAAALAWGLAATTGRWGRPRLLVMACLRPQMPR